MNNIQKTLRILLILCLSLSSSKATQIDWQDLIAEIPDRKVQGAPNVQAMAPSAGAQLNSLEKEQFTRSQLFSATKASMALTQVRNSFLLNAGVVIGQLLFDNPQPALAEILKFLSWHSSADAVIEALDTTMLKGHTEIASLRSQIVTSRRIASPIMILLYLSSKSLKKGSFGLFAGIVAIGSLAHQLYLIQKLGGTIKKVLSIREDPMTSNQT